MADYEDLLAQVFRWKATSDSGDGMVEARLNGTSLGTKAVRAGAWQRWYAKSGLLRSGTNTLTVTRVDAGATPLKLDSAVLGGGLQIGKLDNGYSDFSHETYGEIDYFACDGNMRHVKRVIFGPQYQNREVNMHVVVPVELSDRYAWKLRFKIKGTIYAGSHLQVLLDNKEIFNQIVTMNSIYTVDIPMEDLIVGEHVLSWRNLDPTKQTSTKYIGFDYFQLEPQKEPGGTIFFLR